MAETSPKDLPGLGAGAAGMDEGDGLGARGPALPGVRNPGAPGKRERSGTVDAGSGPAAQPAPAGPPAGFGGLPPGLPKPPTPFSSGGHAAGAPDEEQERWLIQKEDKMDYGPFSMREVR